MKTRIVFISDTHTLHRHLTIPDGDILVHAGDMTNLGLLDKLTDFNDWFGNLPHPHKIAIAGNHDFCFEYAPAASRVRLNNCIYLQDEAVTLRGITFYGTPWSPWYQDFAFNAHRGGAIEEKWDRIPTETDVLVTHAPPFGHGDQTYLAETVGCADLLRKVEAIRPRVHVFGHIHESAGVTQNGHTTFINAASCTLHYQPINPPVIFDFDHDA